MKKRRTGEGEEKEETGEQWRMGKEVRDRVYEKGEKEEGEGGYRADTKKRRKKVKKRRQGR